MACGIPEHGPQRGLKCAFMGLISAHISQSFSFATGRNICVPMYSTVWPWSVAIFKHFEIPSRRQRIGEFENKIENSAISWFGLFPNIKLFFLSICTLIQSQVMCNVMMPLHTLPGYLPVRHSTPQSFHSLLYLFIYLQRRSLRFMSVC